MNPSPILISACLLGENVRYDGKNQLQNHRGLKELKKRGLLKPLCPEVSGGLGVPRAPAEIVKNDENIIVIDNQGDNVTSFFEKGAENTLRLCKKYNIEIAILKESSPSCGSQFIYDGSFTSKKIKGIGITAKLLVKNNIKVFNENQIDDAIIYYAN